MFVVRKQAAMKAVLDQDLAFRCTRTSQSGIRFLGRRSVMAQLIEFHVPANFQPPKQRWTPEEVRGKIIDFPASTTRKSA
jgi:hypothetical protein